MNMITKSRDLWGVFLQIGRLLASRWSWLISLWNLPNNTKYDHLHMLSVRGSKCASTSKYSHHCATTSQLE
jgi:hypothetical protein